MRISGNNNQFENQPICNKTQHGSKMNYEEKNIANSPDPAEYLGRSQVSFKSREQNKDSRKAALKRHLEDNHYIVGDDYLSLLDPVAEAIQNDDELEFIKKCMLERRSDRLAFSIEDVKKLLGEYQKHPETMKDVFSERYENGQLHYTSVEAISSLADAYEIDKDYTKFILQLSYFSRKSQRFNPIDAKPVVEAAQIDKDYVNTLLAQELKYGRDRVVYSTNEKFLAQLKSGQVPEFEKREEGITPRYSGEEIKILTEAHSIDPELTDYLLDLYDSEYVYSSSIKDAVEMAQTDRELINTLTQKKEGKDEPRFLLDDIGSIVENVPQDREFLFEVLNAKNPKNKNYKYSADKIVELCKASDVDAQMTRRLMKMKASPYGEQVDRFPVSEILGLINDSKIDIKTFNHILNKKTKRYDGAYIPLYSTQDIHTIMEAYKANKTLVSKLLRANDMSGDNRYSPEGIASIVEASEIDPVYTNHLISLKTSGKKTQPLIRDFEIDDIVKAHQKDPEYTETLLSMRNTDARGNEYLLYQGRDINAIVDARKSDSEFTEMLVNQKKRTKNGLVNRFDGPGISFVLDARAKDKELTDMLVEQKVETENGPEYRFAAINIHNLVTKEGTDKELIKHIAEQERFNHYKAIDIIRIAKNTSLETFKKFEEKIGDNIQNYDVDDISAGISLADAYGIRDINELKMEDKKKLLRSLIAVNADIFNRSEAFKKDFPIIPQSQEEYCEIVPALVRSLGIETKELSEGQLDNFNVNLTNLSDTLARMSDKEFNDLTITQEYSKNHFIKDSLAVIRDLDPKEQQKVFDYFGFELRENPKNNDMGYSIIGYPINLNNGKKLAVITDDKTKEVVERLRPYVIKFSENNRIISNNPDVENELNEIADALPEIRTMIGKGQHKAHDFDVFKHSLKVMQKVRQDEGFEELNDSDKKVMLLASLMHDITKIENIIDETHVEQSAFDTLFIAKKINLTQDEEIKLYTLIRHHEWLANVNKQKNEKERTKAQQSVAFDFQQSNMFDLALMFTHADLRAIKRSDLYHDKLEGDKRIDFNGQRRSFGQAADFHADKIRGYINELKKTRPLLPTTKMPKASEIEKLITEVSPDGSTNIKGVYVKENKDKKRLVVVKFNEVEDKDWEHMGLPKGSTTKGTIIKKDEDEDFAEDIETGNIKFFVHGLDYPNQLAKFDAFSLLNSDALLSVSYAERPETKYRFFRPQGVMLDVSADYVYGGGASDSGSGFGKNIQIFKDEYIFGGYRESDRRYISDLIKNRIGMDDDEYIEFYEKYKNKPMTEIEPPELRESMIKSYATLDSKIRLGSRYYNEMYLSNPKSVMGVFAYEMNENKNISDPLKFLEENKDRTDFLQDYAIEHDIPFFVFGN